MGLPRCSWVVGRRWCLQPQLPGRGPCPGPLEPLGVQWGKGQLSCWLEPAGDRGDDLEMSVSPLPPASRTSLGDWDTPSLPPTSSPGSRWCQRPP